MQGVRHQYIVLTFLFVVAGAFLVTVGASHVAEPPRWPTLDSVFTVDDWSMGPLQAEMNNSIQYVNRTYRSTRGGAEAVLSLTTSPEVKRVYRAGPDVPFLGSGYTLEPLPPNVLGARSTGGAFVARRGTEVWLQIFAFGERRGLLGNDAIAWSTSLLDTALGRPNDYYLARVTTLMPGDLDASVAREADQLADVLFPRIAAWYAHS